ncbi:unnamed protein product [Rotaria sordida]|uniref:Uncharacterized protein n=1 Tax=Rotaria sordida TaxID=392033 RepID=A0A815EBT6_9BILA|nr:unnamed protein product [Rotaria sordida]CAF4005406.1 unnamed protein product [Rotaria sordida]
MLKQNYAIPYIEDHFINEDQKRCHIDVDNNLSLSDSLVDSHEINAQDFTTSVKTFNEIEYEDEHSFVNQNNTDGHNTYINRRQNWEQNGFTVTGNDGVGNRINQLSDPFGISIDHDQTIYVVDSENYRIMGWKLDVTSGKIVAGNGDYGNETNQLK